MHECDKSFEWTQTDSTIWQCKYLFKHVHVIVEISSYTQAKAELNAEMISLGALCQLDVSVQRVCGEGVEDKRLDCHALHRRVSSLSQTECFHHVKP